MLPTWLDWLNLFGGVSSIIGLFVTWYTLYKVGSLRDTMLRRRTRDEFLQEVLRAISELPSDKLKVPVATCRQVEHCAAVVRSRYASRWPFMSRRLKRELKELVSECAGGRQRQLIESRYRLILMEIDES